MLPVLTASGMRAADRETIDTFGIPGFTLMETAGQGAARLIERRLGSMAGRTVLCVCGKGNNGGDGYVVARVLHARGARVGVASIAPPDALPPDAAEHYRLLVRLKALDPERLELFDFVVENHLDRYRAADLVVDALLGTGLTSPLRSPFQEAVDWINAAPGPVVALDVATGLDSDTGAALGRPVDATGTVTMGALKAGLLLGEGPRVSGWIEVVDIGIPASILAREAARSGAFRATDADIRTRLTMRRHDAHKYTVGTALIVAGSVGYTGAAILASTAAARSGAGAVVCATPSDAQPTLAARLTDTMTVPLPITLEGIEASPAMNALEPRLEKARALLVGPGLGRLPGTRAFVRELLSHTALPTVVDADGLFALAEIEPEIARLSEGRWIMTPHRGEFLRLAGAEVDLTDRIQVARTFAARWQCVLVLKGLPSLVAAPDGRVYINGTGNPLLATAGTGDVLAGLSVGFLAQGLSPLDAALCALHLGGACADRHARFVDPRAMLASELIGQLPELFRTRFSPES